jgi:hypothetical protein
VIILLGLFAVTVHELGHALVTVHHGRHVRLVGLRLHLGSPAFYVDSLDALLLTRRQRLAQAAAGPWAEWLVNAAAALVLLAVPADSAAGTLLQRFVIVNAIGIATNLLPFVGLDGSLLLSDLIREPDLSVRARNAMRTPRALPARDWWMLGYAAANTTIGVLLLVSAGFFWWLLFGGLVQHLYSFGPVGVAILGVGAIAISGQLTRLAARFTVTANGGRAIRRHIAQIRFRTERRWRTRAIHAFLELPELAGLDAAALGVIAGRLQRLPTGTAIAAGPAGYLYLERDRTVIPVGDSTMVLGSRVVLLLEDVLAAASPSGRRVQPSHCDTEAPSPLRHAVAA